MKLIFRFFLKILDLVLVCEVANSAPLAHSNYRPLKLQIHDPDKGHETKRL